MCLRGSLNATCDRYKRAMEFVRQRPPLGKSHWLLEYWSRTRLCSVEVRRNWIEPDLKPLQF
jgi:hypothetical protein